jgi:uncharacterized membrane protein YfcA
MSFLSTNPGSGLLALAAFVLAAVTSTAGVSGAFLLLPLQIWVLGVAGPVVTATNLLYNLVATPGGVYRYFREGRMLWSMAGLIALGALPGMLAGCWMRVHYLARLGGFRWVVGCVLALIGVRMLLEAFKRSHTGLRPGPGAGVVALESVDRRIGFSYAGENYRLRRGPLLGLSAVTGLVGGVYGIGGGALIAPFLIWLFRLPVYAIAGAALGATFLSSAAGVVLYWVMPAPAGIATAPDWTLGFVLGLGGLAGTYVGASLQRYVPQRILKALLGVVSLAAGIRFFLG